MLLVIEVRPSLMVWEVVKEFDFATPAFLTRILPLHRLDPMACQFKDTLGLKAQYHSLQIVVQTMIFLAIVRGHEKPASQQKHGRVDIGPVAHSLGSKRQVLSARGVIL
jgi:hypothetical protein